MNNIHNNWRKFLIEGSYNESKLLREITDDELDHIETALHEMEPEDMAFNELFKGKQRILLPFAAGDMNTELGQFLSILGTFGPNDNYQPLDKEYSFAPNWKKGVMEKVRAPTPRQLADMVLGGAEPKRVIESMKINKWFSAVQKAIKNKVEWDTYKSNNDIGYASRPMTDEEQKKQDGIDKKLRHLTSAGSLLPLSLRFGTRRDGNPTERMNDIIDKIEGLKNYWQRNADYIKKNPQGDIDSNTYSIVITRNPIDILRMSDFDNITSCHSPPSRGDRSYYHCAVAEAHGEGAIAYVVYNRDLEEIFGEDIENITLDDYEDDELFFDDARDVGAITPISRLRIRLVRNYESETPKRWDEGVDIAVPEESVYGKRIPGFRDAIMNWAKANQSKVIDKIMSQKGTLDLGKFTAFGGSYEDRSRESLLLKLLGITQSTAPHTVQVTTGRMKVNTSTEDNLEGIGPASDAAQLEREAIDLRQEHNLSDFDIVRFGADNDEESAWIWAEAVLRLKWDADEWNSLPSPSLLRYIPDELEDYGDGYNFLKDSGVDLISADNKIIAQFEIDNTKFNEGTHHFYSSDQFDEFLTDLVLMEGHGGKVDVIRSVVEQFMKREGYMQGGAIYMLGQEIQANEHPMYEWDWHVEEGYDEPYELISAEVRMWLDYGDIPEAAVKKIFSTREFWLDIRKRMHAPIHEHYKNKYYVDIEKFVEDYDTDEGVVEFKLNYAVGDEDPDDTVKIFKDMIDHWDDEDNLYALFDKVLKEYALKVAKLTPMKYTGMDMNENKMISNKDLFNGWRHFLGRW